MSEDVLVTGAAGFAGSHMLDLLAAEGVAAVAWHRPGRTPPAATGAPGAPVRWMAVDMLDATAVRDAVRRLRPSAIVHCAGAAHVGGSWTHVEPTFAANVRGTHNLADALLREVVAARVVITSSATVYRTADRALVEDDPLLPASPYGLSKLAQEMVGEHAAAAGLDVKIARAFNHAGPRQDPSFSTSSFARQIAEIEAGRRAPEIVVGNLEPRRDVTDVRDTVRAYAALLWRGVAGRPYNVCSGRAVAIGEILDLLVARARVSVAVRSDARLYRPNDTPLLVGDASRIRGEVGWEPTIPLEQTLTDLLDYWRARCGSS